MRHPRSSPLTAAMHVLLASCFLSAPGIVHAADINVPADFASIQAAMDAAAPGDTVVVAPGTYAESLTLRDGVALRGAETARTILNLGNAAGPIITVSSAISSSVSSLTFLNALVGIKVTGNPVLLEITNNVFEMGSGGAAVVEQGSPAVSIENNVFYGNATAVSRDEDIVIRDNIFTKNAVAVADTSGLEANTTFNDFFNNATDGPVGTSSIAGDPLFVDPSLHDFHLMEGSACIDTGDPAVTDGIDFSPADMGAYGGPNADPIPFPVQGLAVASTTATSIDLTWQPNRSYLVTSVAFAPGSYNLYYGNSPRPAGARPGDPGVYDGTDAFGGFLPSPVSVPTTTDPIISFQLPDLSPPLSLIPATPVLLQVLPGNTQLGVVWSAVSGATGYKVHYGVISAGEHAIDVGNVASYAISGLTNGQAYKVAVSSYGRPIYYLAVTALDGVNFTESAFSSEVSATLPSLLESGLSNIVTERPDSLAPYPVLPDKKSGCFIATAAYGSPSAPEVLVLRSLRDRYLLSSTAGRRFVAWYYRNGPVAAAFVNGHPVLKPAIRIALLPVVAAAALLTAEAPYPALCLFGIAAVIVLALVRRKVSERRGLLG